MSNIQKTLGDMSTGVATSSALVTFLESHASLISLGIGFCGLVLAAVFYWLNYRLKKKEFDLLYSQPTENEDEEPWLHG